MKKIKINNKERWLLTILLPCVLLLCFSVWQLKADMSAMIVAYSDSPVWDLREAEMEEHYICLKGNQAEFVPEAFLTPQEFTKSHDIQIGEVKKADYYTARFRILVPKGKVYAVMFNSVDYADSIYINGQYMQSVGQPGKSPDTAIPGTAAVYYTVIPENGIIEVVHQVSNFVHKEGGNPVGLNIGSVESISRLCARRILTAAIIMGGCLLLFVIHLVLFFLSRTYRTNLYFSLFCLVWLVRTGVTGPKVITALFPDISWYLTFRMEYMAIPLAGLLIVLALDAMFKGLLYEGGGKIYYCFSECGCGAVICFSSYCYDDTDIACCVCNPVALRALCV